MFDIGFWEISLILALGLVILGPQRLPRAVSAAGMWLGRARGAMRKLQREIQRELMIEETREAVDKVRRTFDTQSPSAARGQESGAAAGSGAAVATDQTKTDVPDNHIGTYTDLQDDQPSPDSVAERVGRQAGKGKPTAVDGDERS